ncbi:MAG TPA: DUF2243 domain-containing protein [Propionibacteriaceae bacterium]|nr:DUF2243 domain-containing protein [Propionibacteriaceae bacterium]
MSIDVNATPGSSVFGPGVLLGVGLGAFVDGIVLHQLLRWHHLLSSRPGASLTANLIADGVFHAGAWLAVLVGVLWLWRRSRQTHVNGQWTALVAAMVAGWGSFNVVEGLVDHYSSICITYDQDRIRRRTTSHFLSLECCSPLAGLPGTGA